jgi:transcription elongation factor Elf1
MKEITYTISGSICPNCKKGKLIYTYNDEPYKDSFLSCPNCDNTYKIKYNQMFLEDVLHISGEMIEVLLKEFKDRGMCIDQKTEDSLFEKISDMIEDFSTGDYKNHL